MPRDYAWLDVNLFDHPKIRRLLRSGGPEAFIGWLRLVLWARKMTDPDRPAEAGVMCREDAEDEARDGKFIDLIIGCGLADETLDGKIVLHDFGEHHRIDEWAAKRAAAKRGGQTRGAQLQAQAQAQLEAQLEADADRSLKPPPHHTKDKDQNTRRPSERVPQAQAQPLAGFDEFYEVYPRHTGKLAAQRAWARALKHTPAGQITAAAAAFAESCERKRTEARYIPHPATWLNAGRWDDEPDEDSGTREVVPDW